MKKVVVAALAALTTVGALAAAGSASAQPWLYGYGDGGRDRAYGSRYGEWRRGDYAGWRRYPARMSGPGGGFRR